MIRHTDHHIPWLEPLPGDFAPELQAIDDRLIEAAGHAPVPSGLADRVFQASVRDLSPHVETAVPNRWRLFPQRRVALHQLAWSQMAMAASLAIVLGVALYFMHAPSHNPSSLVAHNGKHEIEAMLQNLSLSAFTPDSTDRLYSEVDHLHDTYDLGTREAVTYELAKGVAERGLW